MARAVTLALLFTLTVVALANAKPRSSVAGSGGACNHQNLNVGASARSEYGMYRGRGSMRVVASGGVAHGATRTRGKTYKRQTQAAAAIGIDIPIRKGR
ncbi:hypothetical protein HPB52_001687 [Rhipicephalus sanguineus]|uniref:Uncharacterized protein n=1 Tax=Rhipicephalus sanguineus TaxID=34632 RepID=A0A9D4SPI5_RHISA|nr:hypothetical protein HPB52_001687 [Rhipicephalus sanguineus]